MVKARLTTLPAHYSAGKLSCACWQKNTLKAQHSTYSECEVCAALVEHVLLVVDQEHTVAQVAAPAVLGTVHLLIQRKAHIACLLFVGLQERTQHMNSQSVEHTMPLHSENNTVDITP